MSWEANIEPDLKEYWIYRNVDNSSYLKIAIVSKTTTSFVDHEVSLSKPLNNLSYKIKAVDTQNLSSVSSNIVSASGFFRGINNLNTTHQQNINKVREIKAYSIQNYPNPFNPTTNISYQIPNNGFVSLKVYNSLGQEVKTLVNENKGVGNYSVEFNASNLPSGMYFYKLQSGKFSQVKKMLLVK